MAENIIIKNETATGTLVATNQTIQDGVPTIFFTVNSFRRQPMPVWTVGRSLQREGNFTHYAGSDDEVMQMEIVFYGDDRETNHQTVLDLKDDIIYLDTDGNHPDADGKWTIRNFGVPEISPRQKTIIQSMTWVRYNN